MRQSIRVTVALLLIGMGIGVLGYLAWSFISPSKAEFIPLAKWFDDASKRSTILITIDTTRADYIGAYGNINIKTPVLDQLASEGILFEKTYAVSPITLVSHASILSGLYPMQHGVRNNGIHYVSDEVVTLAEAYQGKGYQTGAFVSASVLDKRYGLDQGFAVYNDDLSGGRERHRFMVPDRPAEVTVDAALKWVNALDSGEKYFLWLHLYDPHAPYSPPPPYRDEFREDLYSGEIAYMDAQIGRFLSGFKHPGEPIVIVMGDHGESLGEHKENTHAILGYNSTLHVPFLMKIPGA